MKRCEECGKPEVQEEIFSTIDKIKSRFLCQSCVIRNDAVILTKPAKNAFDNINSKENVYNRLRKEAGLNPLKSEAGALKQLGVNRQSVQISPIGSVKRSWKTAEEKQREKELEQREKELEEIRLKKLQEEEKARELEELEKEGKINFKSKVLTIFDLRKIGNKRKKAQEVQNKDILEKEKVINEIIEEGSEESDVIKDHNEF